MDSKYVFVAIYILVDFLYVFLSKPFYNRAISNIQGHPMKMKEYSYLSALLSYTILGVGWLMIVANRISSSSSYSEIVAMAVLYGLVIYGVFNTTLYVMFSRWDTWVALRDTMWGVGWITVLSLGYLYTLKKNVK